MNSGEIVCFHGSRSLGGYASGGVRDTPVDEYIKGLAQMESNSGRIFGSIHGYYGVAARPATVTAGGTFLAILREPVKRVSSIFAANVSPIRELAARVGHNSEDVSPHSPISGSLEEFVASGLHKRRKTSTDDVAVLGLIGRGTRASTMVVKKCRAQFAATRPARAPTLRDLGDAIAALFFGSVRDTVRYDADAVRECCSRDLIIMERFTTDSDYYNEAIWSRIVGEGVGQMSVPLIKRRINDHVVSVQRDLSPEALFAEWGAVFQEHFLEELRGHPESVAAYRHVGYFCP